jgi:DNA-binding GntR family transcriptional regulator
MSKNAQPVVAKIVQALATRIVGAGYAGSVPLRQAELAQQFGTSHIPVREALASLAQKGLVRIVPNRGAVTVPLSAQQCAELAEMRVALELIALRRAVPRQRTRDLDLAARCAAKGRSARGLQARAERNWAFHRALYRPCESPFLLSQLETLWLHADRYLRFAWAHAHYESQSDDEHFGILTACQTGDVQLACRKTRQHILSAAKAVSRLLE